MSDTHRNGGVVVNVVVIGAGLGGLSAAAHLSKAGHDVTIVEREDIPGGRAGMIRSHGFSLDNGPTVLTMPDLLEEAFLPRLPWPLLSIIGSSIFVMLSTLGKTSS